MRNSLLLVLRRGFLLLVISSQPGLTQGDLRAEDVGKMLIRALATIVDGQKAQAEELNKLNSCIPTDTAEAFVNEFREAVPDLKLAEDQMQILSDSLSKTLDAVAALTSGATAKCAGFTQLPGARELMVSAKRLGRYVKKGRVKYEGQAAVTINGVDSGELISSLSKAWLESLEDHA
eukprot:CAMPEP_0169240382 /NCGR_PEP_ID=MMETSP1016-20121227/31428_1 /TAXON_ID=342587 /ORGANISM="Karlodinium micrum, Strain CCMP2283" /LENGTH=176 /DNA_ID=CAMNT_0009320405 /DNA_START=47 /DNA_END=574 /DNA_ORIENTATION=-